MPDEFGFMAIEEQREFENANWQGVHIGYNSEKNLHFSIYLMVATGGECDIDCYIENGMIQQIYINYWYDL
jgi:hypothetical protein